MSCPHMLSFKQWIELLIRADDGVITGLEKRVSKYPFSRSVMLAKYFGGLGTSSKLREKVNRLLPTAINNKSSTTQSLSCPLVNVDTKNNVKKIRYLKNLDGPTPRDLHKHNVI